MIVGRYLAGAIGRNWERARGTAGLARMLSRDGDGATPLAEVAGYGSTADAFRITDIQPDGRGAMGAMMGALKQAGRGLMFSSIAASAAAAVASSISPSPISTSSTATSTSAPAMSAGGPPTRARWTP